MSVKDLEDFLRIYEGSKALFDPGAKKEEQKAKRFHVVLSPNNLLYRFQKIHAYLKTYKLEESHVKQFAIVLENQLSIEAHINAVNWKAKFRSRLEDPTKHFLNVFMSPEYFRKKDLKNMEVQQRVVQRKARNLILEVFLLVFADLRAVKWILEKKLVSTIIFSLCQMGNLVRGRNIRDDFFRMPVAQLRKKREEDLLVWKTELLSFRCMVLFLRQYKKLRPALPLVHLFDFTKATEVIGVRNVPTFREPLRQLARNLKISDDTLEKMILDPGHVELISSHIFYNLRVIEVLTRKDEMGTDVMFYCVDEIKDWRLAFCRLLHHFVDHNKTFDRHPQMINTILNILSSFVSSLSKRELRPILEEGSVEEDFIPTGVTLDLSRTQIPSKRDLQRLGENMRAKTTEHKKKRRQSMCHVLGKICLAPKKVPGYADYFYKMPGTAIKLQELVEEKKKEEARKKKDEDEVEFSLKEKPKKEVQYTGLSETLAISEISNFQYYFSGVFGSKPIQKSISRRCLRLILQIIGGGVGGVSKQSETFISDLMYRKYRRLRFLHLYHPELRMNMEAELIERKQEEKLICVVNAEFLSWILRQLSDELENLHSVRGTTKKKRSSKKKKKPIEEGTDDNEQNEGKEKGEDDQDESEEEDNGEDDDLTKIGEEDDEEEEEEIEEEEDSVNEIIKPMFLFLQKSSACCLKIRGMIRVWLDLSHEKARKNEESTSTDDIIGPRECKLSEVFKMSSVDPSDVKDVYEPDSDEEGQEMVVHRTLVEEMEDAKKNRTLDEKKTKKNRRPTRSIDEEDEDVQSILDELSDEMSEDEDDDDLSLAQLMQQMRRLEEKRAVRKNYIKRLVGGGFCEQKDRSSEQLLSFKWKTQKEKYERDRTQRLKEEEEKNAALEGESGNSDGDGDGDGAAGVNALGRSTMSPSRTKQMQPEDYFLEEIKGQRNEFYKVKKKRIAIQLHENKMILKECDAKIRTLKKKIEEKGKEALKTLKKEIDKKIKDLKDSRRERVIAKLQKEGAVQYWPPTDVAVYQNKSLRDLINEKFPGEEMEGLLKVVEKREKDDRYEEDTTCKLQ